MDEKTAEHVAKAVALTCVRNGFIEELHCGKGAHSQAGDYSDVRVVVAGGNRELELRLRRPTHNNGSFRMVHSFNQ
jgi:hypothetical protein